MTVIVLALVVTGSLPSRNGLGSAPDRHGTPIPGQTPFQVGTGGALPFSPASIWNNPLGDNAPLSPDSDALVQAFNHQWLTNYGSVGINTDDYSIPIYTVPATQPTVSVSIAPGCHSDPGLIAQFRAVPIPPEASPANGSDHSLVIWQPSTDTEWELWVAQRAPSGGWSACWGGRMTHVSTSNGAFPSPYGVAASGLAYLGGTIKVSELRAGEIMHALSVNLVHTTAGSQVAPANRNDGNSTAADAIPEGTRFRLDPTIDVTKLGLGPAGVVIARALQRYGMIVTDTSGAVVVVAEDGESYVAGGGTNPYPSLFTGQAPYEVLSWIPWNRLQVVSPGN